MLTRDEFTKLYQSGETDKINEAYASGTPAEQAEYLQWLEELKPAEPASDDPLAVLEEEIPAQPDTSEADTKIADAVDSIARQILQSVNPREQAATRRAQRSNMLRSIRARFRLMEPFTVKQCADRIGRDQQEVAAYLVGELRRNNPAFQYNPENRTFFLDNPFE